MKYQLTLISHFICCLLVFIGSSDTAQAQRSFTVLAVNDIYRIAGVEDGQLGGLDRLRRLRIELEAKDPGMLLLHAGDFLFPSLLSRLYKGTQMIDVMNHLDGNPQTFDARLFVTFGNHEFDKSKLKDAGLLQTAIKQSGFTWLSSNIHFKTDAHGQALVHGYPLLPSTVIVVNGIRVGIMGLTTPNSSALPAYLEAIADPIATARAVSHQLRQRGAEVVIAITHLAITQDQHLLAELGELGPDVIFGGHEHNQQSVQEQGRYVIKANADARSATVATINVDDKGAVSVDFRYQILDNSVKPDQQVQQKINYWLTRHDQEFCVNRLRLPAGCLSDDIGQTQVQLIAEELEIRRYETNIGNWLADQARDQFAEQKADIAVINSGSLRLNQDIAIGLIKRRTIEELFAYPLPMYLLRISGATLQKMLNRSVQEWTGNGHWLQVSGLAYRHNPTTETAEALTLISSTPHRLIKDTDSLLIVVPDYLVDLEKGQNGYTMLNPDQIISKIGKPEDLRDKVFEALEAQQETGIAPIIEGRICNSTRDVGVCLALEPKPMMQY